MKKTAIVLLTAVLSALLTLTAYAGALNLTEVTAGKADKAPVIDGVFDPEEGWGDPIVSLDSSNMKDFAETDPGYEGLLDDKTLMIEKLDVYMKWDDTFFYYCANVVDPEHYNPEMDAAIWRGDSIIFHVVSVPNDDSRARILFGMDNDGEPWAFQETMEDGTLDTSTVNDWKITRNADTKVTTYEAFFKWEDIIPSEKLGEGEAFYLRDLFLLANAANPEPAVAVVPEGYTNGTRNYYKITLAADAEAGGAAEPEPASEEESRGFATLEEAAAAIGRTPIVPKTFVDGSNGFGGETAEYLWDGDTGTKFCTNETPIHSVVKLDGLYSVDGVIFATANDNAEYNGRLPYDWTIQGSTDGENWTTILNGDDTFFEEKNFTYYGAAVDPTPSYSYIRFVAEGALSEVFQLSEAVVTGTRTGDLPAEPEPEVEVPQTVEVPSTSDETLDDKAEAPNTFDFGLIAAAVALSSFFAVTLTKKKR